MANVFQRIFYSPIECKVLDFIKENKNKVEYYKEPKIDEFNVNVGITHNVSICADGMVLNAKLTKYRQNFPFRDSDISYTFHCTQPKEQNKCNDCTFSKPVNGFCGFASTVYAKMLNHYIAIHGCPCQR